MFEFNEYIKKGFMSLELLKQRLNYRGGNQEKRMIKDKLQSLKKALLYSYQAATAQLSDGREFRCLINPDKNNPAYDNKIISIPYKDICLNSPRIGKQTQGQQEVNLKPGNVFIWKETNTPWLVYLEDLQEDAYFRAEIRKCEAQVTINNKTYAVYIRGPIESSIDWNLKKGITWNSLNYSSVIYITSDENTRSYLERFKTIQIYNTRKQQKKTWRVAGVDQYFGDGIIQVFLEEFYQNPIEKAIIDKQKEEQEASSINEPTENTIYIDGPTKVKQYDSATFNIKNASGGKWYIQQNNIIHDLNSDEDELTLNFDVKVGKFILIYRIDGEEDITLNLQVSAI